MADGATAIRAGSGTCRSCANNQLSKILDLGDMPLVDRLLAADELDKDEPRYPLELMWCARCSLVQIAFSPPPATLFARDYPYLSSVSQSLNLHARHFATRMIAERNLDHRSLVLEIGSNDGYLLRHFKAKGVPVLGIDPAPEPAQKAKTEGIACEVDFFTEKLARDMMRRGLRADLIVGNNVLAHVPDPNDLAAGVRHVLKEDGIASFEFPYVVDLVTGCEFDTIYHEHHCYFSVTSLVRLFERHRLRTANVEHLPLHGGSLRLLVRHMDAPRDSSERPDRIESYMRDEQAAGVHDGRLHVGFADRVAELIATIRKATGSLRSAGCRLAAYGAAAKGAVLLNATGIDHTMLEFVADRNPFKQGKFLPGVHVPIVAPDALMERRPDCVLLLTWNFAEEILLQQQEYIAAGGRFLIPLPQLRFHPPA